MNVPSFMVTLFSWAIALIALYCPQSARAQSCPGSQLHYIIRDEKGAAIDAGRNDLRYQPFLSWHLAYNFFGRPPRVPEGVSQPSEELKALGISEACSFHREPTLNLTLNGKSMNLTFHTHSLPGYGSMNYLVDSLPFQQGTFEIDILNNLDFTPQFYEATGWKKLSDKADAVPEPTYSFVHGRVIDAITKKPIVGARVGLLSWLAGEMGEKGSVTTKEGGRFGIDRLRDDYMANGWEVAVAAEHSDYTNGYTLFYPLPEPGSNRVDRQKLQPFKSIENATIELMPLATVSGRFIDAATGGVPGDLDRLDVTFTYRKRDWLPGGNIEYPTGEFKTKLNPDGSFTIRTSVGKNAVSSVEGIYGGSCGKCYYLTTDDDKTMEVDVPKEGLSELILKLKSRPR